MIDYDKVCDFGDGNTLLTIFLRTQIADYREPTRKGTRRGEKVGFPKHKYVASLFMVTSLNQRQIADRLGIPHKLLLKWHMEEDYRAAIESHCKKFLQILKDDIHSKKPGSIEHLSRISDAHFYGDCIIQGLLSHMEEQSFQLQDAEDVLMYLEVCKILSGTKRPIYRPFLEKFLLLAMGYYMDPADGALYKWRTNPIGVLDRIAFRGLWRLFTEYMSEEKC